ncbi:ABC transporter permease [Clostridium rectalis]|uniref:ABC transporter permease n=1 Tax=Clostridium rectalis TaxID=2040295 RepID=UPI000F62C6E3|nr:ABC transporter permease [Clostridium rectalis]
MLNIIICELKKFKRIWISLIVGVFIVIEFSSLTLNSQVIKDADSLFTWVNLTVFSYGFLIVVNLLISYMIILEFNNNTIVSMVTYRHERWKLFLGKIICAIIISLFLYITEFVMLTLMSYIFFKESITVQILIKHFLITLKSFFFQMLMITVTATLAIISKKIIVTIVYIGVQIVASFIFLTEPSVRAIIPFPLPVISNLMLIHNHHKIIKDISILPSQVILAFIIFVLGILYGCFYINKMEVE